MRSLNSTYMDLVSRVSLEYDGHILEFKFHLHGFSRIERNL